MGNNIALNKTVTGLWTTGTITGVPSNIVNGNQAVSYATGRFVPSSEGGVLIASYIETLASGSWTSRHTVPSAYPWEYYMFPNPIIILGNFQNVEAIRYRHPFWGTLIISLGDTYSISEIRIGLVLVNNPTSTPSNGWSSSVEVFEIEAYEGIPFQDSGVRIKTSSGIITLADDGALGGLRINASAGVISLGVVEITSEDASPLRINTSSGIKAIAELV